MDLKEAVDIIQTFEKGNLTERIKLLENQYSSLTSNEIDELSKEIQLNAEIIDASQSIKKISSQINVVIHATGILLSLPYVLEKDEHVLSLSLGAGNSGKNFNLETDQQIGEFKFIHWRKKSNTIRQNQLFKDFFLLAEYQTTSRKCLYVIHKEIPLKFLN